MEAITITVASVRGSAALGALVTYFFFKRSQVQAIPRAITSGFTIVDRLETIEPGIEVQYQDQSVERLSVTTILFWNGGKKTIKSFDVAPADPILISVSEGEAILSARVVADSRQVTKIRLQQQDPRSYQLNFDFLDQNDGAEVRVVHTDRWTRVGLGGTIMGVAHGFEVATDRRPPSQYRGKLRLSLLLFVSVVLAVSSGMLVATSGGFPTVPFEIAYVSPIDWLTVASFGVIAAYLWITTGLDGLRERRWRPPEFEPVAGYAEAQTIEGGYGQ